MLESMKQQQEQFMKAIIKLTIPEPVAQPVTSPPKFETFDKSKEKWG